MDFCQLNQYSYLMARRAWLASSCAVLWLASVASISSAINSISSRDTRLTNLEDNVKSKFVFGKR